MLKTSQRMRSAVMRSLISRSARWQLVLIATLPIFALALPANAAPKAALPRMIGSDASAIRIAERGWGMTRREELQFVLDAVHAELGAHFPARSLGTVEVVPGGTNPRVLFERGPSGEYIVELSARDGRWHQFVYQFAHELCHIYSNYDNKVRIDGAVPTHNQWFEESVCEAAAIHIVRQIAAKWQSSPAGEQWRDYAPLLTNFAQRLVDEAHRHLPPSHTLAAWFDEHRQGLRDDPYQRHQDEVVSNRLLELFARHPEGWAAISFLNADRSDVLNDFEDYLDAWCQACPEHLRPFVEEIMALFDRAGAATRIAAEH